MPPGSSVSGMRGSDRLDDSCRMRALPARHVERSAPVDQAIAADDELLHPRALGHAAHEYVAGVDRQEIAGFHRPEVAHPTALVHPGARPELRRFARGAAAVAARDAGDLAVIDVA